MLAWTLERNRFFGLDAKYQRNITDSDFVSTRVTRDGKEHEVVVYPGGGRLELWVIEAAIEGVSSSIDWRTSEALPKCPTWDEVKASQPR